MVRLRWRAGFTLVELMVVTVILAILATVAVGSYKRYQRSARQSEGIAAINDIRMKQETFYNTYSAYVSSTTSEDEFQGVIQSGKLKGHYVWDVQCPDAGNAWCQLGFKPPTHRVGGSDLMYFQFQTIGWSPGVDAPSFIKDKSQRWVTATARGIPDEHLEHCYMMRITNEIHEAFVYDNQPCE